MSTAASVPSSSTPLHLEPGKHAECLVSFGHSKKVISFSGAQKLADLREGLRKSDLAHLLKDRLLIQVSTLITRTAYMMHRNEHSGPTGV